MSRVTSENVFKLRTDGRTSASITTKLTVYSGANCYFRSIITQTPGRANVPNTPAQQSASFGYVASGSNKDVSLTWNGLASNTSYRFQGDLDFSWDGSTWNPNQPEPVYYVDESIITYPAAPSNVQASGTTSGASISWTQPTGGGARTIENTVKIYKGSTLIHTSPRLTQRSYTYSGSLTGGDYRAVVYADNVATDYDRNQGWTVNPITAQATFTVEDQSHPEPTGTLSSTYSTNVDANPQNNSVTVNFTWSTTYLSGYVYAWTVQVAKTDSSIGENSARSSKTTFTMSSSPKTGSKTVTRILTDYIYGGETIKYKVWIFGKYQDNDDGNWPVIATDSGEFIMPVDHYPTGTLGLEATDVSGTYVNMTLDFRPGDNDQQHYSYAPEVYVSTSQNVSGSNYVKKKKFSVQQYIESGDLRWTQCKISGLSLNTTYYAIARIYFSQTTYQSSQANVPTNIWSSVVSFTTAAVDDTPALALWSWTKASDSWNDLRGSSDVTLAMLNSAKYAVEHQGATTDFHHKVWNDLVKWALQTIQAQGASGSQVTGWAEAASMTSSSRVLTAARWNNFAKLVNTAIERLTDDYEYYIDDAVISGATVFGSIFTEAVDNLNSQISVYLANY